MPRFPVAPNIAHMINGTVTLEEFVAAQRYHSRTATYRTFAVLGCMFILGVILTGLSLRIIGWSLMGGGIGGTLAAVVTKLAATPRMARIYRQLKFAYNPISYEWNESQLCGHGSRGDWRRAWTEYVNVKEANSFFLLYHADNLFEIVPKRWFKSEAELNDFRSRATVERVSLP